MIKIVQGMIRGGGNAEGMFDEPVDVLNERPQEKVDANESRGRF